MAWKPPADQVVASSWKPPADQVVSTDSHTSPSLISTIGQKVLEAVGAPNEMAGEAIRVAREGYPFRSPTILRGAIPESSYTTSKKPPSEFTQEITGGIQGLSRLATAPIEGKNALQAAADEIRRKKDQPMDMVNQLAFSAAAPEVASAPLTAATKIGGALLSGAGKLATQLSSAGTNVPMRNYGTLFNNPDAFLPGTMEKAKDVYAKAKETAGIPNEITVEQANVLKNPKKYVFDTFERIMGGENVTPKEALFARNGLDLIMPQPNSKNGSLMTVFDQMRNAFQNVIKAEPAIANADKVYGPAKAATSFKSFVPLTSTGKPGFVRTGAMLSALASPLLNHHVPPQVALSALAMSPAVAGAVTSGLGVGAKALNSTVGNPNVRNALIQAFIANRNRNK